MNKLQDKLRKQREKRRSGKPQSDAPNQPKQLPHGRCEVVLFGQSVTVPDDRPRRRLRAIDLVDYDKAPPYLKEEVDNYRKLAQHHGVNLDKITLTIAEYMMKGYWQMAAKLTEAA